MDQGDVTKGELGFAALPGKQEQFKDSFNLALNYAKALDCKLIHIMAGTVNEPTEEHAKVYEDNLRFASKQLENEGIVGLIEPINCYSVPKYYLNSYEKGHIQVAQVPFRNEPNTSGEINYPYVFGLLEELGYQGWIGLEYKPLSSTKQGLGWMQRADPAADVGKYKTWGRIAVQELKKEDQRSPDRHCWGNRRTGCQDGFGTADQ
uniref:Xylose isomerase-like TIM barrel domain-containing protein n=1 Tax=Timema genevievae TaxID=629358 RepID=A0A7R9PQV8_TIMGE|nr:unnamed protein product [Timema genevievae]